MERQQDYVLRTVEERGVRFVQMWFTDVLGIPKSFQITPAELENALEEGMTFDGSTIDGFSRVQETDVLAMPDAKTFSSCRTWPAARPSPGWCATSSISTDALRRRPPSRLAAGPGAGPGLGFSFFVAPEMEYFYFAHPRSPRARRPSPWTMGRTST